FSMLGVDAALGRTFRSEESQPGRDRVVVLAHRVWARRFGADPSAIGRQLLIDSRPFTVIGVLPEDFQFYQPDLDLWMPLAEDAALRDRQSHSVMVIARLGIWTLIPLLPHAGTNVGMGTFGPMMPSLDLRVLAFSIAAAALTGVAFGVVPAVQTTRREFLRLSAAASARAGAGRALV